MAHELARTYSEQLIEIRDMYRAAGKPWPASAREIAEWAINEGHYKAHRSKIIAKAAEEFAAAMREEYHTDAQGRRVRSLHAARCYSRTNDGGRQQKVLWHDMREADRGFMERAFQLRRRQIVGECRQLKTDVDSFNDNHPDEKPIQLVRTFENDVAEANEPIDYRPHPKKPR